ncbi:MULTISPECIES: ABC transporter substrate-binding protein [Methylobacterium]|uniref:ABC transporter substrate-binding protein n=1 Tax=Methylobacterium TaxID=407 RepID=UPI0013E9F70A|nr:ABC transporter substrate-binding protein [Methylobacterium sp. DB0501]NGM34171.1 ABC transporter substrate-binding protein [Methylobacterium sp. DB0501]
MSSPLSRRRFGVAAGTACLAACLPRPALAQTPVRLRMVLNWRYQGPQGFFFLAEDRGFLREEGIDLVMDQGNGSGAAVGAVGSGSYDLGFGDINALVSLVGRASPGTVGPLAVAALYNRPPFTIAVRADGPIRTPQDLKGRTVGGPANDSALKLFPAFARMAGIDPAGVTVVNMQPALREQMLQRGQVDGVFGFVNTIRFSAKLIGLDPDRSLRFIDYADAGMDLYSNAVIASRRLVAGKPEALRRLLRAFNRGITETLKDPDAAVEAVARREPLIDRGVEKDRLIATLKAEMSHPEGRRIGIGDVDDARFARSIAIVAEAESLPRMPAPEEVFSRAFLPPLAERVTTLG